MIEHEKDGFDRIMPILLGCSITVLVVMCSCTALYLYAIYGPPLPEFPRIVEAATPSPLPSPTDRSSHPISQATQEIHPINTIVVLPTETTLQEVVIPTEDPTQTPTLKPTPSPTTAITPTPEPIIINGTGDSIQNIDKWPGPAIIRVVGNASQRHFAVIPYDSNGNRASSLVNTTDYYDGRNLIDFEQNQHTSRLEITSEGEWTIEILPLASARVLQVPGTIDGNGDDVLLLMGGTPDIANISGNPAARHFAVLPYGNGRRFSSMVNTTDPYEGQVLIDREAEVLQVIAEGAWSISIAAAP